MPSKNLVFLGIIASSNSLKELSISFGFLSVEDGKITRKGTLEEFDKLEKNDIFVDFEVIRMSNSQFLMPGLIDCHTHAPQFPNLGLGLDRPLLEWLDQYTFPLERRYSDVDFAAAVYDKVVKRLLENGTTTACYFGSLHLEGTLKLAESVVRHKQRGLVGKVSMNIENHCGYYNNTEQELKDVEKFIETVLAYKNELVQPVVTPRFAVSCDSKLMTGLACLAKKYGCRIQSHISENTKEIEHVLKNNPGCENYGEVYDKCEVLHNMCIMAHAIHLTDDEIRLMHSKGVSIAHCPASNTRLRSGLCPVRKYLRRDIRVGLGTDVSGGDSASMLDAMRRSMDVSTHLELLGNGDRALSWREAFYLATLGGAKALNLDDKIGSLEVGKDFDALLVDVYSAASPIEEFAVKTAVQCATEVVQCATEEVQCATEVVQCATEAVQCATEVVQRFVYAGDDRNLLRVYVKGHLVKGITS